MKTLELPVHEPEAVGSLLVVPFLHPQGCRGYLLADPVSGEALALDPHLDLVGEMAQRVTAQGWQLAYVVDSHTHADHPSGAGGLAARFSSMRLAHEKAGHQGVTRHPADGETLHLGEQLVTIRHAPGHTPDHIALVTDGALFSGDTLLINGVARTDFLGGDAGTLFDTLQRLLSDLPDETVVFPGHDYEGRISSTVGGERATNPWLQVGDRGEFVRALTANPPPRPANMDDLLRLNREGVEIPSSVSASQAARLIEAGGATSVIDVRTGLEFEGEHVAGSRSIPLDQLSKRVEEVRATPAPRLLMCRTGSRAEMARQTLERLHVAGLSVVEGGIEGYRSSGGATEKGRQRMSLERQVRIGAGSLVLLGVGLGAVVHPAFLALSAFVGAGLVFAGVTDWCGMGLLLAKAPWNRTTAAATAGACAAAAPACAASAPASSDSSGCAAPPPPSP